MAKLSSLALLSVVVAAASDVDSCTTQEPQDDEISAMTQTRLWVDKSLRARDSGAERKDYGHPAWLADCKSIYLDVGSNIGVQVRKFYEAEKYPDAAILKLFDQKFGPPDARRAPANASGMCVLGFEPNPTHHPRLEQMEAAYKKLGWHVHFYHFAAWKEDVMMEFNITDDPAHSDWGAGLVLLQDAQDTAVNMNKWRMHSVRAIEFSAFLQSLPAQSVKVMKMDIEGSEYETLARMLEQKQLCKKTLPLILIEAHSFGPPLKLWTLPRGKEAIINRISQEKCPSDVNTKVSSLDDESYLLDVDTDFGGQPFQPNPKVLEWYRSNMPGVLPENIASLHSPQQQLGQMVEKIQEANVDASGDQSKHKVNVELQQAVGSDIYEESVRGIASASIRKPRVNYLFLVNDHIFNEKVWERFFSSDDASDSWKAFVHCQEGAACKKPQFEMEQVPPTPSKYCFDLVSPMVQLLRSALTDAHPQDQYVFVSESTFPAKPRSKIHETLMAQWSKDAFCMSPASYWPVKQHRLSSNKHGVFPIAGQWVTLSFNSALKIVRNYDWGAIRDEQLVKRMTPPNKTAPALLLADGEPWYGCLDEMYFVNVLFGEAAFTNVDLNSAEQAVLKNMGSSFISKCHTLVSWDATAVPKAGISPPTHPASYHAPGVLDQFTIGSLKHLRESSYLFVRKVSEKPKVIDSCETFEEASGRILTSTNAEPNRSAIEETNRLSLLWKSNLLGVWSDIGMADSAIHCAEGKTPSELLLSAQSISSKAVIWSGSASLCGKRVSLTVANQVWEGTLDEKRLLISWQNGAQWKQSP